MPPHSEDDGPGGELPENYWEDEFALRRIRERFLEHFNENKDLYDTEDVERNVRASDLYIQRFLINQQGNEELTLDKLKTCFKWRKESVLHLSDESFPYEFYETGGLFMYKEDREGTPMLYMRIKLIKKSNELEEHMKRFLTHKINTIDRMASGLQSWGVVFDCSGMSFANVQLDMLRYLIQTLREYYPVGVKYILVYEIPWILSGVQKVVFSMVPDEAKKLIQFKNKKNISKVIAPENLPDYMGGHCKVSYSEVPAICKKSFVDIYGEQYNEKEIERIRTYFEGIMSSSEDSV